MLFIVMAILCVPLAWISTQLVWMRQRHAFLEAHPLVIPEDHLDGPYGELPSGLGLLHEQPHTYIYAPKNEQKRAAELFPEAVIRPPSRDRSQD
jgi:hypothetical protein